jgi:hypothetical protein
MAYRSFTALATRKSPAFRGKSLRLDGVSDFIDLQGYEALAFRIALRNSSKTTSSTTQAPCSWDFWVRFDSTTKSEIIAHHNTSGNDMEYFIMKMYSAKGTDNTSLSDSGYYNGPFCGLISDSTGYLRIASGWGLRGVKAVSNRLIRYGHTPIESDTWYHVVATYDGNDTADKGIGIYINGVSQTLSTFYPVGTSTGEQTGTATLARVYYYPYAPTTDTFPGGYSTGDVNNYTGLYELGAPVALGRNQDSYLAMDIHRSAFWSNTLLDVDDAVGLYNNGTPWTNYHTNQGSGTGQYDKGEDVHATQTIKFTNDFQNGTISFTDLQGITKVYIFALTSYASGYANGAVRSDGKIQVLYDSGGNTFSATITHTNLSAAINANQSGIVATNASSNTHVILTQAAGGAHGNTRIVYNSTTFAGYVNDGSGAAAPLVFVGGIDRLHGVWRFQGPNVAGNLDSTLQSTSNRLSEFNEDVTNGDRKQGYYRSGSNAYPVDGVTPANYTAWHHSTHYVPAITKPALNNGGLWIGESAKPFPYAIGDTNQGGIIFYLDGNGGGLAAAASDQSTGAEWGCVGTSVGSTNIGGMNIGDGQQNTLDILAACSTSGIAAKLCADLTLNGYSDWFLPSFLELNEMSAKIGSVSSLGNVGNFADATTEYYWSSTQYYANGYSITFDHIGGTTQAKDTSLYVRAIRAF